MDVFTHKIQSLGALALALTLIIPLFPFTGNAQERAKATHLDSLCAVQFPINISDYDPDYRFNRSAQSLKDIFVADGKIPVSWEEPRKPVKEQKPLFALKTNLLYDAATILNISLEVPIGNHWSIAGELIFPWWLDRKNQNCLQLFNGNLEVKYWFHPRENQKKGKFSTMTGWFIGVYGGGAVYDVEHNGKGYQGESLFSTGFMGGYAHSIGKCLRLEYSLGVGYMQTHYRHYEAKFSTVDNQWELYRQDSGKTKWIGPTHVKISLVWMLSRNVKKGGTK